MEYLYADIYKKLEEKIKSMSAGEKLPSERAMVQEYGVSRNVLREALVLLSDRGMIEIRPGKGSYVTDQHSERIARQFEGILDERRHSQIQVMEVRELLELAIFEKAAMNANEDDVRAMEQIYREMETKLSEKSGYGDLDFQLHMQIAKATHNEVFPILVQTLYSSIGERLMLMEELFPEAMKAVHRDHLGIIDAIRRRDVKAVRRIGKRHFDVDRYALLRINAVSNGSIDIQ